MQIHDFIEKIKYRVSKGSVLGAILFVIYVRYATGKYNYSLAGYSALYYVWNALQEVELAVKSELNAVNCLFSNHIIDNTCYINLDLREEYTLLTLYCKCMKCLVKNMERCASQ